MVGERLKRERRRLGLTQEKFGELIDVTKVSISGYEKETRKPTIDKFVSIVDILGVTPDYLLGRDTAVVAEDDTTYRIKLSKEEIRLIKELKKNPQLYTKLTTEPRRTIELINRKIN